MSRFPIRVVLILVFLSFPVAKSVDDEVKQALVQFLSKLSLENMKISGWKIASDPCFDQWEGVKCDSQMKYVKKITLEDYNLAGDLCKASSLAVLSLKNNKLTGVISEEVGNCQKLDHLYLNGNQFSGSLPDSLSGLVNLKRLDISNNNFSGDLPDLQKISGLKSFFAQNNQLSGGIPDFDFSDLENFNVSNNGFSGPIPDVTGRFTADSFGGNPGLCGKPLLNACLPKKSSNDQFFIYSGYVILALIGLIILTFKIFRKKKMGKDTDIESEFSVSSMESRKSHTLQILSTEEAKGFTFDDLLRAPAEVIGRGSHGSTFKVILNDGVKLAVKRFSDSGISSEEFHRRIFTINQVKHPSVLLPVSFYSSEQEKLLVYKYQQNGSLFQLLHGSDSRGGFDWESRLTVAARIAEAMAFMHRELKDDGICHGNLKSKNILFDENMNPCISEYGLMKRGNSLSFEDDVHGFGVILLELLTGKMAENNGYDLFLWAESVVREERRDELFDSDLVSEGASEDKMAKMLRLALACLDSCFERRLRMSKVAEMVDSIREEEDDL